jgi:hypothetical protein
MSTIRYKDMHAVKMGGPGGAEGEGVGGTDGRFEAIVSVFGNPDHWGDVVLPGAFTETLAQWKAKGDPIPVLYGHQMSDPRFNIGAVVDAAELEPGDARIPAWVDPWVKDHGGLWVAGQLDVGADATEIAVVTRRLMKLRRVTNFSYAYETLDSGWGTQDGADVYELRRLGIFEVSPCLVGCNGLTNLLDAKATNVLVQMAGMTPAEAEKLLSTTDSETCRKAIAILGEVMAARDGDATRGPLAKTEEPDGAKAEEPPTLGAESIRLFADLGLLELEVV